MRLAPPISVMRRSPRCWLTRPLPRETLISGGEAGSVRLTGTDLVERGHQRDESPFGFPGQSLRGIFPRQIDLLVQAFDVQEPEDVPPSLLRLRRQIGRAHV